MRESGLAPERSPLSPSVLVIVVCTAQVFAQLGSYGFPALLPDFMDRWSLDNSQAGTVTAAFYAGYTCAVPILVTLTDRIDPKRVYLFGVACIVISYLSFGFLADGFLGAAICRTLTGIGWAGTYMTGLKMLADRVDGRLMTRAVSWHAAGIGIAGALSYVVSDGLDALIGWRWTFGVLGISAAIAWLAVLCLVPGKRPSGAGARPGGARLFDFRPVFRNRSAMAYSIGYCVHTWEMMALKGWAVAFLAFVAIHASTSDVWIPPTAIATIVILVGTATSLAGNEISIRFGRQRLVRTAMAATILLAITMGFYATSSYLAASLFILAYTAFVWLDSSSLTAGSAASADPSRRGATLAIHSMLGYGGGFVGPLALGLVLDWAGGMSPEAWGYAFAHIAGVVLLGRIAFGVLRPRDLPGDRAADPNDGVKKE
jgi:predicted MFS family arabinose efflux permease